MQTLTVTMRVARWVPPFVCGCGIVARCGVPVSIDRVADLIARHGITFTTQSARAA